MKQKKEFQTGDLFRVVDDSFSTAKGLQKDLLGRAGTIQFWIRDNWYGVTIGNESLILKYDEMVEME